MASSAPHPIALPDGVRTTTIGQLPAMTVETPLCSAEIALQGAQLTRWQPAGQAPVLFVSTQSRLQPGAAIRGGVPLCGPWFGPGRRGDQTPAHGFYRLAPWRLTTARAEADGAVTLGFTLTADDLAGVDAAAGWPSDAELGFEVELGTRLRMSLTTRTGAEGMDLEQALHTYFAVGDVRRVRLDGLAGVDYVDKLDDAAVKQQVGEVTFTGETDRVYRTSHPTAILDPVLQRRIDIETTDSASTVVWNPWVDKAAAMSDFADDEWPTMLCVETANVLADAVVIPPDDTHTITATISVGSL